MFKHVGKLMKFWGSTLYVFIGINAIIVIFKILLGVLPSDVDYLVRFYELSTYSGSSPNYWFGVQSMLANVIIFVNMVFCIISFIACRVMKLKSKMQYLLLGYGILSLLVLTMCTTLGRFDIYSMGMVAAWAVVLVYHCPLALLLFVFLFRSEEFKTYRKIKKAKKDKPVLFNNYLEAETEEQVQEVLKQL